MTSEMTISPVAHVRCWASIAIGLRRGRGWFGCAKVLISCWPFTWHISMHFALMEYTACLRLERVEVVITQCRQAGQEFRQHNMLAQLSIDAGRDRSSGIEKALALRFVGLVDEAPDGPEDDEIERQRQGKHEQPQPQGDAQAIDGALTGQPGGALRQPAGTRIRCILHDASTADWYAGPLSER